MSLRETHKIYAYTTTFNIKTEKDLDDLWSYCIFRLNLENSEHTYDRFARLYNFLNDNKKKFSPIRPISISLQESSQDYFISIETPVVSILNEFMKKLTLRNLAYDFNHSILNYSIQKRKVIDLESSTPVQAQIYNIYTFIEQEDLTAMTDSIEKIQDCNYEKAFEKLSVDEINAYRTTFSYYSSYLKLYTQLNPMSSLVAELSVILSLYNDDCIKLGNDFRKLLQAFVNNLSYWQEKLFITGGEELHFMDESFKADLSQIKMVLNLYDEIDEENSSCTLDNIFDF